MKPLCIILGVALFAGCANLDRTPNRWVTVVDLDTGEPVPDLSLVYSDVLKPYFIVGRLVYSRAYVSGPNGKAHVPSGQYMGPALDSGYRCVADDMGPDPHSEPVKNDTIYVRSEERYRQKLEETLNQ